MNDVVNKPPHYTNGEVECIDAIESALTAEQYIGYLRGNVLKYLWRFDRKNGLEDLEKALWYLKRLTGYFEPIDQPFEVSLTFEPSNVDTNVVEELRKATNVEVQCGRVFGKH